MNYNFYYNNVPGEGLQRNNLIYTSLISDDKKVFVQWYYNDTEYHKGKNQVVDPAQIEEKWQREIRFLTMMRDNHPDMVPEILEIDEANKKIYLRVEGPDLWQRSMDIQGSYADVLPDWEDQMLGIITAHKNLGLHKYSMHPSSYFIVDGKLKSINYFFTYLSTEPNISVEAVGSHISHNRQAMLRKVLEDSMGLKWDGIYPWSVMDELCWSNFTSHYPKEFTDRALAIYTGS